MREQGVDLIFIKGNTSIADFYLGKYLVTNVQYTAFLNELGSDRFQNQLLIHEYEWGVEKNGDSWQPKEGYENHPVVMLTWYGANTFCQHYNFCLPTEAEWKYAAKANQPHQWAGTNDLSQLSEYAWYRSNANQQTHPVGQKKPNDFGLYDISGNVWEWCQDGRQKQFARPGVIVRAACGGSIVNTAEWLEIERTHWCPPRDAYGDFGFRVLLRCDNNLL